MKNTTKIKLGILAGTAAAVVVGYKKYKEYNSKFTFLRELRTIKGKTFPTFLFNPTCIKLLNKFTASKAIVLKDVVTTNYHIKTYDNSEILVNVFEPLQCEKNETLPCLLYLHGGAYVMGSSPGFMTIMEQYVNQVHCKIVYVNYRTAYESSVDTCFEDSYSALMWTYEHAEELHIDKDKLAIGGDSAGGGIAASITHMVRERKGPKICFQMLIYPVIDATLSTPSMKKYTDTPGWNARVNTKMWKEIKKRMSPDIMKYASPIINTDFTGLCNAYVEVEQFDCLHDEGILYAEKLKNQGYEVDLNDVKGTYHGFEQNQKKLISRYIIEKRSRVLRKAFGIIEM